jgi:arsenite methyltransferase
MKNIIFLSVAILVVLGLTACGKCPYSCKCKSAHAKQVPDQLRPTQTKEQIKNVYEKTVQQGDSCSFGGRTCACSAKISQDIGYTRQELDELADANLGLGCGNPISLGEIKPGQTILDLGSGAGLDCFLAARKVGTFGKVIGVDMTPAMIKKATENAKKYGYENVEFRLGDIEELPVENNSVDIIISNCVLSLVADKERAFKEAYRVLKPGGQMYVSDIVLLQPLSDDQKNDKQLRGTCVLGALLKNDYLSIVDNVGFDIDVLGEDFDANKKKFNNPTLAISSLKYIAIKPKS